MSPIDSTNNPVQGLSARKNFSIIFGIVLAEPISSTVLLPFVYFMVRDFGYSGGEIGMRAGIITSSFFLVQMVSNPFWAILSNHFGRKLCLVLGLLGTAISMVAFGLSRNLTEAILSRSLCGLMNGNNPIARTTVGELAEQTRMDKAKAFSLFGFCVAVGWMVGPLIGGTLSSPARQIGFSGPGDIFVEYPWLLPCLFIATYNTFVAIAASLFMDEVATSLPKTKTMVNTPAIQPLETDALLAHSVESVQEDAENGEVKQVNFRKVQGLTILTASLYFVHIICFDELFPLFAASSLHDGVGLSFDPASIAHALVFAGPAMLLALATYPRVHKRYGSRTIYRATAVLFTLIYPLFSVLPLVSSILGDAVLWVMLPVFIMTRYALMVIGLASMQILFNDVAPASERALLNGLGQSAGSLARAIGPTLGGTCWSWSISNGLSAPLDYHFTFYLLSALGILQYVSTFGIPSDATLSKAMEASVRFRAPSLE